MMRKKVKKNGNKRVNEQKRHEIIIMKHTSSPPVIHCFCAPLILLLFPPGPALRRFVSDLPSYAFFSSGKRTLSRDFVSLCASASQTLSLLFAPSAHSLAVPWSRWPTKQQIEEMRRGERVIVCFSASCAGERDTRRACGAARGQEKGK